MEMKKCNFVVTKDEAARKILQEHGFVELNNIKGDLFVFVNDPRKFANFSYEELPIRFTNKMYF